jgi:DNA-binding transcriptional LysR family regulator
LFERQGNQIKLTKQGQMLLEYTEEVFRIYRKMEFELAAFSEHYKSQLHVGASSTVSQYVIPFTLAQFHNKYKDIAVKLMNGNTEQIEHALLSNDIDLGIIEGKSKNKGIKYTEFIKDEIVLIANAAHPFANKPRLSVKELKSVPMVIREAGSGTLDVIAHALKSLDLSFSQLNIEMELGSTEAIKTYLHNSNCVAFLSMHSVVNELANKSFRVIDVEGLSIVRYFHFIERQGTSEQLANLFIHFARQNYLK